MRTLSILLLFSSFSAYSQKENKNYYSVFFAPAYSRFDVTQQKTAYYPTLELRSGSSINRNISKRWALSTGINFCLKLKQKSYVKHGNAYYGRGSLNPNIDETASKRSHYAFEVPLMLRFYHSDRVAFNMGVMARFWGPSDLNTDILASRQELGILVGGTKKITDKLCVGIDIYSTLAPVLSFRTRNQFAQLKLEYFFNRR